MRHSIKPPRIQILDTCLFGLAVVLSLVAALTATRILDANNRLEVAHQHYEDCSEASNKLMMASDFLTSQAHMYVATGNRAYLDSYLGEILIVRRRNAAVSTIESELEGTRAHEELADALDTSNELAERELYAMRLQADAVGTSPLPESLQRITLSAADSALSKDQKHELALEMVLGTEYQTIKNRIVDGVERCTRSLISGLRQEESTCREQLDHLLTNLRVLIALLVGCMAAATLSNYFLIVRPMRNHAKSIQDNEPLAASGSQEMRHVVASYNELYEENHRRTMLLKHEAETDALTGLLNRGSYDKLIEHHGKDIALLLIDIDYFKQVNDTYGHDTGDQVLKKVARSIANHFRTTDYACRIGGDEFAVIMTEMRNVDNTIITGKLEMIAADLRNTSDGLPPTSISVGIALSESLPAHADMYKAADEALYQAKRAGRDGYTFYNRAA